MSTIQQMGFLDQIVGETLKRMGYQLKVVHLSAERAMIAANNGIVDGELNRVGGLSSLYPNLIQAGEHTIKLNFVVFSKNRHLTISGWESLAQYRVGFIRGWKIVEKNLPPFTNTVMVRNHPLLFSVLVKDRVDCIIAAKWPGLFYLKEHDISNIHVYENSLASPMMYLYFNKKHEALVPEFTSNLRAIKNNGMYDAIYNKTLGLLTQ